MTYVEAGTFERDDTYISAGPALGGWLAAHHRDELGGRPFGDGTPPKEEPIDSQFS